ncbi:5-demethoxyubiquinol-8 5-hydroxylase UbiM [Terricaulis sp.]|uniref:5-demethoxyubiquinol-8 5-hydroxylase UbiM n=1 Tax=Terricaulis sp. TaxID=2768686 RepID=UPI0037833FCA
MHTHNTFDLLIVGAGPAGLSLAARLADAPLSIAVIDKQSEATLASPSYDGREIALTQASTGRLQALGAWDFLCAEEISPLVRAEVLDGASPYALAFAERRGGGAALGALVPNAAIRRTLFERVAKQANCTLFAGAGAAGVEIDAGEARVRLSDGRVLTGKLLVAADTRFSALRPGQGIGARMVDFGRTMLVCRICHERPHKGIATEWFDHGQTIAMLPLAGDRSSFVLTLDARQMREIETMGDIDFAREVERRTGRRWGAVKLDSERYYYPLVAVYAERFVAPRFALLGDAAVGMHPVTAHGFNFGLRGAFALGQEILSALKQAKDIANPAGLSRYERGHRRATLPLFAATNAIAKLYSDERPMARFARGAALRLMNATPGARRLVEKSLSGAA